MLLTSGSSETLPEAVKLVRAIGTGPLLVTLIEDSFNWPNIKGLQSLSLLFSTNSVIGITVLWKLNCGDWCKGTLTSSNVMNSAFSTHRVPENTHIEIRMPNNVC
jgi:hypothetical protein